MLESDSAFFHFIETSVTDEGSQVFQTTHLWAGISFTMERTEKAQDKRYVLEIHLTSHSEDFITVVLNDRELGKMYFKPDAMRSTFKFPVETSRIIFRHHQKPGYHNHIVLFRSNTHEETMRPLDLELWQLRLLSGKSVVMSNMP